MYGLTIYKYMGLFLDSILSLGFDHLPGVALCEACCNTSRPSEEFLAAIKAEGVGNLRGVVTLHFARRGSERQDLAFLHSVF